MALQDLTDFFLEKDPVKAAVHLGEVKQYMKDHDGAYPSAWPQD